MRGVKTIASGAAESASEATAMLEAQARTCGVLSTTGASSVASPVVWALTWVWFLRLGVLQAAILAVAFASLTMGVGIFVAYLRLSHTCGVLRTLVVKRAQRSLGWGMA